MSHTRGEMIGIAYSGGKIPGFGFARTADSIASDGVVDSAAFEDFSGGEGDLSNSFIVRPLQSDPNRVKRASVIDGDKLTHEGPAYTDLLTDLVYRVQGWLHPDTVNECARLALHHNFLQYLWPLSWELDNDFASSSLTSPYDWTAAAVNCTPTKTSTGGVYTQAGQSGPRNMIGTNSSANGYLPGSRLPVMPGDQIAHGAIGRANGAYTPQYILWDVTNGVALETVTWLGRAFQRVFMTTTIPPGCYQIEKRYGGVESNAVTEWDCLLGHPLGQESGNLVLPDWLTKRFQFLSFGPALYGRSTADKLWNATSRKVQAWYPAIDYEPLPTEAAASVTSLQINRPSGLEATDYWLLGRRPFSDIETLDNETDTTEAEEEYLMAAFYMELAQALFLEYGDARWQRLYDWASAQLLVQQVIRPQIAPPPERKYMRVSV